MLCGVCRLLIVCRRRLMCFLVGCGSSFIDCGLLCVVCLSCSVLVVLIVLVLVVVRCCL